MAKILLAEDEQNIASFIRRGLQEFGHEVQVAHDGGTAWAMLQEGVFDLLVLDVIMPKMDGLEVCRQFRLKEGYHTPVIMLTALGTTEDIVKGLDAGADDYLVKPFSFQELEARIKALLRRGKERPDRQLWCHDLVLDCDTRRARRGDTVIELTVQGIPSVGILHDPSRSGAFPSDTLERRVGQEFRYEYQCGGRVCELSPEQDRP